MDSIRTLFCALPLAAAACTHSAPDGALAHGGGGTPGGTVQEGASRPASRAKRASAIVFSEIGRDLGTVVWPGGADAIYPFSNTGTRPVAIVDVLASCGCSSWKLRILKDGKVVRDGYGRGEVAGPLLVVEPGEKGELSVRFETATLQGNAKDHMSRISLATDERVDPIDLFLKAQIERIYDVVPPELGFDPMGAKQTQTKEVRILVFGKGIEPPFDAKVVGTPPGVTAQVLETTDGVRPVIWVGVTAGPNLNKAGVVGQVLVEAMLGAGNTKEKKVIKIQVYVPVASDVYMKPSELDFQAVEAGKAARSKPVTLELLDPGRDYKLGIPRIEGESADRLKLEVETVTEGHKYTLTLVAPEGLPEAGARGIHGLVRIETGLSDFPEVRIPYRAYTRPAPANKPNK
jgi:hypothetical protein